MKNQIERLKIATAGVAILRPQFVDYHMLDVDHWKWHVIGNLPFYKSQRNSVLNSISRILAYAPLRDTYGKKGQYYQ